MVFNFIESGINLFDDTFNTIKSLFADVATQAALNALTNRVTTIENSSTLTIINRSPNFTPIIRLGGYKQSNANFVFIDWGLDSDFDAYYRLQIKASPAPYNVRFYSKESGGALTVRFTFNIT